MDSILSQDEINALLNGMDVSGTENNSDKVDSGNEVALSDIEKDAIGEIANISMGTSATTLFTLVNRRVDITTPVVSILNWEELISSYSKPCVCVQIKYTNGLKGSNILILKEEDVKIIADLMMGGDGSNKDGELNDLHLSAISEAMNQMMGSSATSLSSLLSKKIDISPPISTVVEINDLKNNDFDEFLQGVFVRISFKLRIGDLIDSNIIQLYPLEFAKEICSIFNDIMQEGHTNTMSDSLNIESNNGFSNEQMNMTASNNATPYVAPQIPPYGYPNPPVTQGYPNNHMGVNVQPAQFQNFANSGISAGTPENINLIMDVPLDVTVELGRTKKSISDILEFAPGTIIELDKIAGEPIDVLVNGKYVAKGEVVVIEESFGIRVTEIIG